MGAVPRAGQGQHVAPLKQDPPGLDPTGRRVDRPHDRRCRHGFSRPAFARDSADPARFHCKADVVQHPDLPPARPEADTEALHFDQAHARAPRRSSRQRRAGSATMRNQLARMLKSIVVIMIASPGKQASHRGTPTEDLSQDDV